MSTQDVPRLDPTLIAALRADLAALDFTVDGLRRLLGEEAAAALARDNALPARRRLAEPGEQRALAAVTAAFTLGESVRAADLAAAVPRTGLAGLARLGLLADGGTDRPEGTDRAGGPGPAGTVAAACDLRPYGDEEHTWWVVSDLGEAATGGPLRTDHVLGVGGASVTLASWTPRPAVRRALDLGTGCGVQALHLGGHAERIVATDVSARALGYAAFTAALAGADWDLRRGDLFEPVAGERFDLIVSNPPFVISPRNPQFPTYEYRDGGRPGHAVVAELARTAGEHLNPGGIAHFLGNWELAAGQDWREVWGGWLDGTGLDAYVVQREAQDPAEYAETWARDGGHRPGTPAYEALVTAWLDDFAERGVERIGFGVATLHRPVTARATYRDLLDHRGPVAAPMGPSVPARVEARAWWAAHGLAGALERAWVAAPDVTQERHYRPGEDDPSVILIRQGGGLGAALPADTVLAALVGVCDGELTAGQGLGGIAALLDVPVAEVVAAAAPGIEELIAAGMLLPA